MVYFIVTCIQWSLVQPAEWTRSYRRPPPLSQHSPLLIRPGSRRLDLKGLDLYKSSGLCRSVTGYETGNHFTLIILQTCTQAYSTCGYSLHFLKSYMRVKVYQLYITCSIVTEEVFVFLAYSIGLSVQILQQWLICVHSIHN